MNCTLCDTSLTSKINEEFYNCKTCKAIIKDKKYYLSAEEEKERYELHNNDVTDVNYQKFTSPITNYILNRFLPQHKGLDFGSGTGPVISSELEKKSYNVTKFDTYFEPNIEALKSKYDYIFSCEVFEHFYNPKKEVETLISLLKKNGSLLIMTLLFDNEMNFDTWFYKKDPTHVFIYRKETFLFIAKKYNLEIDVLTDRFIVLKN